MLKITEFCWIACNRTNQPVRSAIFSGDWQNPQDILAALEQGWKRHSPFEPYKAWGKDNVWIGSLNHTFIIEKAD